MLKIFTYAGCLALGVYQKVIDFCDAFIKYQLKYERDVFRRTEIAETKSAPTLESELYLYLKARNLEVQNLSKTLCAMRQIVERYGDEELLSIDADLLEKIKGWLTTTGNKWSTIRRKMGIISAMLNWHTETSVLTFCHYFQRCRKRNMPDMCHPHKTKWH